MDRQDRTFKPTPLRLKEARERGNVARSADVISVAVALGGFAVIALLGSSLVAALIRMTAAMLDGAGNVNGGVGVVDSSAGPAAALGAAMLAAMFGIAALAGLAQVGFVFSGQTVKPDWQRISLSAGRRRVLSGRAMARAGFGVAKIVAVFAIGYWVLKDQFLGGSAGVGGAGGTASASTGWKACATSGGPLEMLGVAGKLVWAMAIRIGLALAALGALDYLFQRWQWRKDLMMTRREYIQDMKRMEGDPLLRWRRKTLARQVSSQRLATELPRATVVVAAPMPGPAVAIRYEEGMAGPRIAAAGRDWMGMRIRQLAARHGVKVVEDRALAINLFRSAKLGAAVPKSLFERVAELIADCPSRRVNSLRIAD
jgi:flagellar biosynthetic protein FlhB